MSFLNALTYRSDYIDKAIDDYIDTLSLYMTLLAQSLGDESALHNLQAVLAKYQIREAELKEILQYKQNDKIDTVKLTDDIYVALTNYLVALSLTYIDLVERRYGVV